MSVPFQGGLSRIHSRCYCSHPYLSSVGHFHLPNRNSVPIKQYFSIHHFTQPLTTTILFSVHINLTILVSLMTLITVFVFFGSGLLHLIRSLEFIHIVVCIRISYLLRVINIPFYTYTTFCLSILLLMDILGCFPSCGYCE